MLWAGFGRRGDGRDAGAADAGGVRHGCCSRCASCIREWVDERLDRLTLALGRFREAPAALAGCFAGAVVVQAVLVAFYLAIAHSMRIPIGFAELAVIVPISFIVQMLPVSMNGFGVREATFGFYFTRLGLPLESALLVSFVGRGADHAVLAVRRRDFPRAQVARRSGRYRP